ncbi:MULTISPECIES: PRC-barrel domain-containing protein [Natrialba]|uniref:PRC-barrel domain-containing protein n=2 Tax=Natrialba TaxID=63742 RepID=M0B0Q9_9EURY|nr:MULTISPECIES: PRC-barrel domain-containing protein [Natrialba]ELY95530.1 hypothetical protein C484_04555 [Natrialba taiwanensis DSM 12281]ELZ04476.1 hypothetical protein C480_13216 [Natrialba aegyptia DSM 13077]
MDELFAQDLGGKTIVGTDGTAFGTLHTITIEPKSGALRDLVVDPGDHSPSSITPRTDDDRLRIPVSRIKRVSDQIVVRPDDDRGR